MELFILLAVVIVASAQTIDPWLPMVEPANPLENIDLRCDMDKNQMIIRAEFAGPFTGYLYAKGFYETRNCRALGTGSRFIDFVIPLDGCGTAPGGRGTTGFSNTIVIMNEAEWGLLGMMDVSYSVACTFGGDSVQRFDWGFTVPMITTQGSVTTAIGAPSCSMKIVSGKDPLSQPTTLLFLGDIATMVFETTSAADGRYDLFVSECIVHDGSSNGVITLIDNDGCPPHRKLIGLTNYDNRLIAGSKLAYAHFKVFKFPDKNNVYFECKCSVCFDGCNRPVCAGVPGKRRRREANEVETAPQQGNNVTMELFNAITVVVPPDAKPQEGEESKLPKPFFERLPVTYNRDEDTCTNAGYLIIAVVLLGLLALLFMTLAAFFYHKATHKRKVQEDLHESSLYSSQYMSSRASTPLAKY